MVMKKQQNGVVLLVSLVFLIALTALAAALMQITTTDMKMSGATEDKTSAVQETLGATDEVIFNEVTQTDNNNLFTERLERFGTKDAPTPIEVPVTADDTKAFVSVANPNHLESDCPHSRSGSSVQVFKCNVFNVQVSRDYGRKKHQEVVVQSGVAQQLLNIGN